jgi:23S rRNA (cytosine1962-C5)-methyltransferase
MVSDQWKDYELVDSGNGRKLERFGKYLFARPEAQAVWHPTYPPSKWEKADASFVSTGEENGGHWNFKNRLPDRWQISYRDLKCWVQPTASRHMGLFPEQATHWDWMRGLIEQSGRPVKVLNLFGYTGLATLAAAASSAQVTHVDASKKAIAYAKDNQILSSLQEKPIRWIVDDALKFTERESRRNSLYDGIILDPPKFGRGPKGEVWEFFDLLPDLLRACRQVLSPAPLFVLLTAYAVKSSALTLHGAVGDLLADLNGDLTVGELATRETSAGHLVSHAIYARWSKK